MLPKIRIQLHHALSLCLFFCLIVLLVNSCKKADTLINMNKTSKDEIAKEKKPENFFKLPTNAAPVLLRIANELEKQNKTKEFIKAFIAKEGFPIWDKARIEIHKRRNKNNTISGFDGDGLSDTTVYIPLVVSAQQYVHGFLKATVTDTVEIKIFRQNDYDFFPFQTPSTSSNVTTAEKFALGMMLMDKDVFGSKEFKIEDKRLFHNNTDYSDTAGMLLFIKIDSLNGEGLFSGGTIVNNLFPECATAIRFTNNCSSFSGTTNNTIECWVTSYVTICPPWGEEEGNGGWPVAPSGGGGGGGTPPGGGGSSPCGSFGANVGNGFAPIECNPGPGGNPWPPIPPFEILDLQWMQQNVKDSANDPCITNALNTLTTISSKFPTLIRSFFEETPNFNMTFKKYTNSTWKESALGVTPPEGAITTENINTNVFNVKINKYYERCTDLGLAATIIHEALHCQLLNWYRLAYFSPDSTAIRISLATQYGYLFPPPNISVTTDSVLRAIVNSQAAQHQDMVIRYKNDVGNALYQFALSKNINVDLAYCMDLAWTGCFDSRAFTTMNTQNERDRIYNRCMAEKDPYRSLYFVDSNGTEHWLNPSTNFKGHPCN